MSSKGANIWGKESSKLVREQYVTCTNLLPTGYLTLGYVTFIFVLPTRIKLKKSLNLKKSLLPISN